MPEGVKTRDALFEEIARAAASVVTTHDQDTLAKLLARREEQGPTSTAEGVAFPHAVAPGLSPSIIVAARLPKGIDFGRSDHPACNLVFCMFGDSETPWEHVRLLARLARIVRNDDARHQLLSATTPEELLDRLLEQDRAYG